MAPGEQSLFDVDPSSSELGSAPGLWALMQVPNVGSTTALKLAQACSSWEQLAANPEDALIQANALRVDPRVLATAAMNPGQPPTTSDEVRLVGYFDLDYPSRLQQIASAPAVLWVRGTAPAGNAAAVVGTRHPTKAGVDRVHKVVSVLVSAGYGIVSGLAAGVDTAAHEAALAEGGQTWAYLGSGVDYPTPPENVDLAERIVAAGGGLLAEVDPGTKPSPWALVARDRLQSGSSSLTVIGQSGIPSGTLHTARFTIEQERSLVVVAPPASEADDPAWAGNRALCDPDGCDPAILNAKGGLAERIATRKPTADHVLTSADALADLLE
jgi:DNA processing protein